MLHSRYLKTFVGCNNLDSSHSSSLEQKKLCHLLLNEIYVKPELSNKKRVVLSKNKLY